MVKQLFSELVKCLRAGKDCQLVSIMAESGSAPRGVGAHMLVTAEGRVCGTIGGGAVEHRSEQLALQALSERKSLLQEYHLSRDLGMICGGNATVLFQFIDGQDREMLALGDLALRLFEANGDMWLITRLDKQGAWQMALAGNQQLSTDLGLSWQELRPYLKACPLSFRQQAGDYYVEPLNSSGRVIIFGGGHVAQALVPVLAKLDFNCWVLDNRPEIAVEQLFPEAKQVICADYEDISQYVEISAADYVVVMTHGHAADYIVQKQVMQGETAYLGVIGSRNKVKTIGDKLALDGFSAAQIAAVYAPIGLAIKAETPAEIAISIGAQLIQVRAERMGK